jgi:hypothetical protein
MHRELALVGSAGLEKGKGREGMILGLKTMPHRPGLSRPSQLLWTKLI